MVAAKVDKARQYLVDQYISALTEGKIPWAKGWVSNYHPMQNGSTNKAYKGMNQLILSISADVNGFSDYRWYTFNQAKTHGYKVKKGSHGTPLSYPTVYLDGKAISIEDFKLLPADEKDRCIWGRKGFTVFNAEQIEGVPELKIEAAVRRIDGSELVEQIRNGLGTNLRFYGDSAYYSPLTDQVTMPNKEQFLSNEEYDSTLLHELCHSTGHPGRMDRDLTGRFGSESYAKEELRAEIASSFLMQSLQLPMPQSHIDNHKAYIQSWIEVLKKDPKELFAAIKDAELIEKYALEKGGINRDVLTEKSDKQPEKDCRDEKIESVPDTEKSDKRPGKVVVKNTSSIER